MLLGSLATNLVANLVPSKAKIPGRAVILAAKGTITLTNFKIQKYDQTNLNLMVFIQETIYLK